MSSPQTIAALVQEGSARKPALASRLERAADILRTDPPSKVNPPSTRIWHVPSCQRDHVLYLVDRLANSCTCPDYRQYANWRTNGTDRPRRGAPAGLCKHRLAVEMICKLCGEEAPQPAPQPAPPPGLEWHRQQVTAEATSCPYLALMY